MAFIKYFSFLSILIISLLHFKHGYSEEVSVETGIANSGELTVKGDINIDVQVMSRTDDLVEILNIRSARIIAYLESNKGDSFFDSGRKPNETSKAIQKFKILHERHIKHLKNGNFVAAHEILIEIHELSFLDKVKSRFRALYYCRARRFTRGKIISAYVAGDYSYSNDDKYKLSPEENTVNEKGKGCGPSYKMAKPTNVNDIYRLVLTTK